MRKFNNSIKRIHEIGKRFDIKSFSNIIMFFILPLVAILLLEVISRDSSMPIKVFLQKAPLMFAYEYAIAFCIINIFYIIRNRKIMYMIQIFIVFCFTLIGFFNYYKIKYRNEPLLISDYSLIKEALTAITQMNVYVNLLPLLLGVIGMLACFLLIYRFNFKTTNGYFSISVFSFCFAMLILLTNNVFDLIQTNEINEPYWGFSSKFSENGFAYSIISGIRENTKKAPIGYSRERISETMTEIDASFDTEQNFLVKPNVIIVLYESFVSQSYLENYTNIDFVGDFTPFFDKISENSISGLIDVPGFGGGTSVAEFEVLTGLSVRGRNTPYNLGFPKISSLARVFRENGYTSSTVHSFEGSMYSRYANLEKLGFNNFYTIDTMLNSFTIGNWAANCANYEEVIATMRETSTPDFLSVITMEEHGGYDPTGFKLSYNGLSYNQSLYSPDTISLLNNYLMLTKYADQQMQSFIEYFEDFEEPTIVVFYGDHFPVFGLDAINEIELDRDIMTKTPFFIWSNYRDVKDKIDLSTYTLGAYILDYIGLYSDQFFNYINDFCSERNWDYGALLEDDIYNMLCYDAYYGNQYAYKELEYNFSDDEYFIGNELVMEGLYVEELDNEIIVYPKLKNRHLKSKLLFNGIEMELNQRPVEIQKDFKGPLEFQVMISDSKGKILNNSNVLRYDSLTDLIDSSKENFWRKVDLSDIYVQLFHEQKDKGIATVRFSNIPNKMPYFVMLDNKICDFSEIYEPWSLNAAEVSLLRPDLAELYITLPYEDLNGNYLDENVIDTLENRNATLYYVEEASFIPKIAMSILPIEKDEFKILETDRDDVITFYSERTLSPDWSFFPSRALVKAITSEGKMLDFAYNLNKVLNTPYSFMYSFEQGAIFVTLPKNETLNSDYFARINFYYYLCD